MGEFALISVFVVFTAWAGEQSVGKSFALNHLADTSFAGSAMRTTGMITVKSATTADFTTEGVWMAVTPTDTSLVVALDFEGKSNSYLRPPQLSHGGAGVHSIERSAQEDMLLVLFNAAISNLVRSSPRLPFKY